jgi:hypothetical protein
LPIFFSADWKSRHRKKYCLYYRKQQLELKRCCDKQLMHITVILRSKNIFSSLESFQTLHEIFNPQKKKSAKIKCHLFRPKPQKFHTAEITGYTVVSGIQREKVFKGYSFWICIWLTSNLFYETIFSLFSRSILLTGNTKSTVGRMVGLIKGRQL